MFIYSIVFEKKYIFFQIKSSKTKEWKTNRIKVGEKCTVISQLADFFDMILIYSPTYL